MIHDRLARRRTAALAPGVSGTARVDRRTKDLTKRLRPGEIAVIDHEDLDQVSGQALAACRPAAVINASASTSGRYPNHGPAILVAAGIPLLDQAGTSVMEAIKEGVEVRIDEGDIFVGEHKVAHASLLDHDHVEAQALAARSGLNAQLEAFAANTMEYLIKERDLLFDGVGVPEIRTDLNERHVLVVVRGHHYQEDLAALRHYIREYSPVLIGVDGGADALLEAGHTPTIIVGDMDSVTDRALLCGAELIVHAYRDGTAPGAQRLVDMGLTPVLFPATGTSEDIAMLLADDKGAKLIVAVGTHVTLVDFLDKGRSGMASTFLTRLRVGGKLVDAKGVSRLYRSRVKLSSIALMLGTGIAALLLASSVTPVGQALFQVIGAYWDDFFAVITGPFS